jgi:hypothetical protein
VLSDAVGISGLVTRDCFTNQTNIETWNQVKLTRTKYASLVKSCFGKSAWAVYGLTWRKF